MIWIMLILFPKREFFSSRSYVVHLVAWPNQSGPQDSNQIHWHQEPFAQCSQVMSKRTQEGAGEERDTSKSRPMMNLVSRCRFRDPTVLASTASQNPVNTKSESQKIPLSSLNVQQTGTVKPVNAGLLTKLFRMEQWRQVVFSSAEIWWNVEHKYGKTCIQQFGPRYWYGLWHHRRIGPFSQIKFILE